VSDNSVYSQWGPVAGHRFRIGASYAPDLDDSGALVQTVELDARKYVPLTRRSSLAFRLVAYDSDGNSPNGIGIGGIDTVRGFRTNSLIGFRAGYANIEYRFPLVDQLAFAGIGFQGIRGVLFVDIGTAYFPGITDFDFIDDDDRLDSGVAAYGWGFDITLFGFPVHWDFAKRTDLKDSETFDTNFWIGFRF
jgi:hemolysin activation/secretion protein